MKSFKDLKIRDFGMEDIEACCQIFMSNTPKYFKSSELQDFRNYLQNFAMGSYWIVRISNEVVGCGGIRVKESRVGSLCFGMVRSDLHRMGIGTFLIVFRLLKLLESEKVLRIDLDTSQYNPVFFTKFGFRTTAHVENYYAPGLDRYDMSLEIQESERRDYILRLRGF